MAGSADIVLIKIDDFKKIENNFWIYIKISLWDFSEWIYIYLKSSTIKIL